MIDAVVVKNLTSGVALNINTSIGEYWLESVDLGLVAGDHHSFKYVDQIGETVYSTSIGTRQLSIVGWVAGTEADVKALKKKLNPVINPLHDLKVVIHGKYELSFKPRTSVKYSISSKENNEFMCKFLISGHCPDPMFNEPKAASISYIQKLLQFPLVLPPTGFMFGSKRPEWVANLDNEGAVPVGYKVEFYATGTVVNPRLIDINTQQFIQINKTVNVGELILVDTRQGTRRVVGTVDGVESNYFQYRSLDSSWLELALGRNTLKFEADSGASEMTVTIRYSQKFLEVDS